MKRKRTWNKRKEFIYQRIKHWHHIEQHFDIEHFEQIQHLVVQKLENQLEVVVLQLYCPMNSRLFVDRSQLVVHQKLDPIDRQIHCRRMNIEHFLERNQFDQRQIMNHAKHWQEDLVHQLLHSHWLDQQHQLIEQDRLDQDCQLVARSKEKNKNIFNYFLLSKRNWVNRTYSGPRFGVGRPLIKSGRPCVGRNCVPYCWT